MQQSAARLYPEDAREHRLPRMAWGKFFCGCSEEPGVLFASEM